MNQTSNSATLKKFLDQSQKAADWLEKSIRKCAKINLDQKLEESDFDALENLTSRFARLSDLLVHKVFRLLDIAELENPGSVIDTLNRATKRGLIESDEQAYKIRELRNAITHDYTDDDLRRLFGLVRSLSPKLIEIQKRSSQYSQKLIQ